MQVINASIILILVIPLLIVFTFFIFHSLYSKRRWKLLTTLACFPIRHHVIDVLQLYLFIV